jgi:dihydrofolate synthase/folylpolyglutamate synthase
MTYKEAREFIESSNRYGSKLGLETVTELLRRLGDPQERLKTVHVAGTNGKGSVTAFIASILASQGYLTGRYISPAVFDYREKVQISGKEGDAVIHDFITEKGVSDAITAIKPVCETMVREGFHHPTCFEIETAMAFLYLVSEKVDFAVIETGLGGRLDATNVIGQPVCCVITSVGRDHMQYLGNTLAEIAGEKAGIIKKGAPVVTCNTDPEVVKVLEAACREKETALTTAEYAAAEGVSYRPEGTTFLLDGQEYTIGLLGKYQIENAVTAIRTAEILRRSGYEIGAAAIKDGLLRTKWSGRFEVLGREPYFIIDGAHNEDAALQLKETLRIYFPGRRLVFIMGVLADKDYKRILQIMAPLAEVIITLTPDNSRALASAQLAAEAKKYFNGLVIDAGTPAGAVKAAYEAAEKDGVILAFGSLSYLAEIKKLFL